VFCSGRNDGLQEGMHGTPFRAGFCNQDGVSLPWVASEPAADDCSLPRAKSGCCVRPHPRPSPKERERVFEDRFGGTWCFRALVAISFAVRSLQFAVRGAAPSGVEGFGAEGRLR
jgi:hypothetical protein